MKKEIILVAAIHGLNNQVLIKRTKKGSELPSGGLLKGELLEDAFRRFILEDTGLYIEILNPIHASNFDRIGRLTIGYSTLLLTVKKPTKVLPDSYEWIDRCLPKEVRKYSFQIPDAEILVKAFNNFEG